MSRIIHLLNDFSYAAGIIGLVELEERNQIASWLFSRDHSRILERPDPRGALGSEPEGQSEIKDGQVFQPLGTDGRVLASSVNDSAAQEPAVLHFLALKRWCFTRGDADCAPSVPHGHENAKTQKWPKLNPYTGKVFTAIHQEDTSRRLSRLEMQMLWRDDGFVDHCREQVAWYADRFPHYRFANARRGILAFPRW
jgi:hypothetical protein